MRANRLTRWTLLGGAALVLVIYATLVEHNKETAAGAEALAAAIKAERAKAQVRESGLLDQVMKLQSDLAVARGGGGAAAAGAAAAAATRTAAAAATPAAPAAPAVPAPAGAAAPPSAAAPLASAVALPPPAPPPAPGAVPSCLRVFDPRREAMVFMHIGKAAGTSFREAVLGQRRKDGCHFSSAAGQTAYTNVPDSAMVARAGAAGAGGSAGGNGGKPKEYDWKGPVENTYLSECVEILGQGTCPVFGTLDEAKKVCSGYAGCGGLTEEAGGGKFTIRVGSSGPIASTSGERSWVRMGETHASSMAGAGAAGRRRLLPQQLDANASAVAPWLGQDLDEGDDDEEEDGPWGWQEEEGEEQGWRRRRRQLGGGRMSETVAHLTEAATKGTDWSLEPAPQGCTIPCFCKDHFDWSPIEPLHRAGVGMAPISVMRDPVERAISHFYFCKTLPWTAGMRIRTQSLSEYLADPESMLETRDVWQDGQAGVSWFAGVHIAGWVVTGPILNKNGEKRWRERQSLNATWLLDRAVVNFEKFLWVGILEAMSESLEMLEYQGGYAPGFKVAKKNSHKHGSGAEASAEEKAKLASLMPMDMWFYDHVKRTHEAKWAAYQQIKAAGATTPATNQLGKEHCPRPAVPSPPLPPADLMQPNALPDHVASKFGSNGACMSTRFILKCAPSMYYKWELKDGDNNAQHQAMIPPWDSQQPAKLGTQSETPNAQDLVGR